MRNIQEGGYLIEAEEIYSKASGVGSRIIVFEVVLEAKDRGFDMEEALDSLRQYGAADVVADFLSSLSYDDSCKILNQRGIGS